MGSVVLLSGGIDSLVCVELARESGMLAGCVFVDYGHPAQQAEGWKAFEYTGTRGVPLRVVHCFGMDLGDMGAEVGARVVPSRNAVLLSLAANAARAMGGSRLVLGCNAADQRDYPDCRAPFLDSMASALGLPVVAPLLRLSKREIIQEARRLGLSPEDAWSCYLGGQHPCGTCPSCVEAARGWAAP